MFLLNEFFADVANHMCIAHDPFFDNWKYVGEAVDDGRTRVGDENWRFIVDILLAAILIKIGKIQQNGKIEKVWNTRDI